jgi:putative tryptophan/tyrosine transport system substrate-binding protein
VRRRDFIKLLGGAAASWPLAARAQQAKVYTISVFALTTPSPEPLLKALRDGLRDAGYVEGRNLRLRFGRAMGGQLSRRKTPPIWSVSRCARICAA